MSQANVTHTDNGGNRIDIGGIEISREVLVEVLPDPVRFERHLPDALAVDKAMQENDGRVPSCVEDWPRERIEAVVATLKEVGHLREQSTREIKKQAENDASQQRNATFRRSNS